MTRAVEFRTGYTVAGAVAVSVILTGCISSPTYGTGKTANAHLIDDLTKIVSIGSPQKQSERAYAPRPTIVKPPEGTSLPAPQASLSSDDNPQWLESPEETRLRLRQEASEKRNSGYRSPLASSEDNISPEQWAKFKEAKAQSRTLSSTRRKLMDPPLEYREPAETAPADELGEPEYIKERRRKKAARKDKGFRIGNLWPF
ncbi:MAG: hypothetical protein GY789_06510 [Hyphomicrobiales bacterium]|nr:hypothetical protein [Hyphomicrobiales bacterium]MCP5000829.1 hypothetical protein [Hyphomicrobiales bacterium]